MHNTWNQTGAASYATDSNQNPAFILTSDIDLGVISSWDGLGTEANPFSGIFFGNGKWITGTTSTCGLFNVTNGARVDNLNIKMTIESKQTTFGGLAKKVIGGSFSHIHVKGNFTNSHEGGYYLDYPYYLGSIFGSVKDAELDYIINNAMSIFNISKYSGTQDIWYIGGFAGKLEGVKASGLTFNGSLVTNANGVFVGGFAAEMENSTITDSSQSGTLSLTNNTRGTITYASSIVSKASNNVILDNIILNDKLSLSSINGESTYNYDYYSKVLYYDLFYDCSNCLFNRVHSMTAAEESFGLLNKVFAGIGRIGSNIRITNTRIQSSYYFDSDVEDKVKIYNCDIPNCPIFSNYELSKTVDALNKVLSDASQNKGSINVPGGEYLPWFMNEQKQVTLKMTASEKEMYIVK